MLVTLSPAKALDMTPGPDLPLTEPGFAAETAQLAGIARGLSAGDLGALMGLSDKLALLNADRFAALGTGPRKQAALAFAGDTYKGLEAKTLDRDALDWAQDHLRILSGLYGALRPYDGIEAYRLEMGTKLANPSGQTLYAFWGAKIAEALNAAAGGAGALVNCASLEYFKAVDPKALKLRVITPVFLDQKGQAAPKTIGFYAKMARGAMARFIVENRLLDPAHLEEFDLGGYRFQPEASSAERPVFLRVWEE